MAQFFMSPDEFSEWLGGVTRAGVRTLRRRAGVFEDLIVPLDDADIRCVFVAAGVDGIPPEQLEFLPGADWVTITPPRLVGNQLLMAEIAPGRKDAGRRLYATLRRSLRTRAPLATRATNVVSQGSMVYNDVGSTEGAKRLGDSGFELRQEGVLNIRYHPEPRS